MDFEWDPAKAAANRQKHGIDLADAIGVFEDPYALTRADSHPGEERSSHSDATCWIECW